MSLAVSDSGFGPKTADPTVGLPPRRRIAAAFGLAGAVLVMVLSLTAFVGGSGKVEARGTGVGERALDFSLRAGDQQRVRLDQFRGRPVLLVFAETSAVDLAGARLGSDVQVVVLTSGNVGLADALSQQFGRPVLALQDVSREVAIAYGATGAPTAVAIDRNGFITHRGTPADAAASLGRAAP